MATEIKMPQLGLTMEEGTVERWLKAEGDPVKAGEPLLEITTDKLTNEVAAETDGYIYPIISPLGASLPHMLICLYVPELLFCLAYLVLHQTHNERSNEAAATISHMQKNETAIPCRKSPEDPLMSSIKAITMIGIYIIIFSILSNIIEYISRSNSYVNLALPMLEITKGSLLLEDLIIADKIKTALIIFLTSFGGVCAILQAGHFLRKSGLSLLFYTASKITCAIASVTLHLLLTMI